MQSETPGGQQSGQADGSLESPAPRIEGMAQIENNADDDSEDAMDRSERLMKEEEESFYSASHNEYGDDNIWGLLSGVGGNIYEWYDFAVYGLLASEIGASFFPKSSKELQLINSFGVYLAAFLMRPLGAILFGEIGDRMMGRRNALVMSILLITIPSVLMGMLPTYEQWGPIAPILLVVLRMLQGLSVGGQLAGSYVLSIEQSSPTNRGFRGSICDASSVGGFLLASAVTTMVRKILPREQVYAWGWRIPFWVSLLLAPILYGIVKNSEESKFWAERTEQKETEKLIRESEHQHTPAVADLMGSPFRRRQLAGMIGVLGTVSSSFYILFLWTPVYLADLRGYMSEADADLLNFVVVGCYVFLLIISGKISDSFPHRNDLVRIGIPGIIFACPTMFGMFESESWYGFLLGQLQYAVCLSFVQGSMAAWEVELWMADPTLSFTGVAIGHNVASTLFGGTMPLVATWLYYRADDLAGDSDNLLDGLLPRLIPGFYVSMLGCFSLWCLGYIIRHPHDVRTGEMQMRNASNYQREKKAKQAKKKKKKQLTQELRTVDGYWTGADGALNIGDAPPNKNSSPYEPPTRL
eukprot:CAMPEP_0118686820 /NCGR_PEP_ID=MMETSP0800-20121206/8030_1 /TAXON_ID=210618 ORGANISM="Striatella unipunctata, Strain CCMP2910" /NCGR_SAMPLE_ID=MMETSP0800 /ASSEMBLY_ACC=CAM_ASM_000638 /LENGTH=582 /DNA_ID=CAMNT_0006583917 /DNA_START=91 /DNA_END=1839 /DNA_ORIENTATION=-